MLFSTTEGSLQNGVMLKILEVGLLVCIISIIHFLRNKAPLWTIPRVGKNPLLHGLANARADFLKNGKELTVAGYELVRICSTAIGDL